MTGKLFPPEIESYFMEYYRKLPVPDLVKSINNKFGTAYTYNQLKCYKNNHHLPSGIKTTFQKGHIPQNKGIHGCGRGCERTWFTRGHTPHNTVPVGTVVKTRDGYLSEKVAEPNKWKLKHILEYEKQYGPIPAKHAVIFMDGDRTNTDISNLKLIKRCELAVINHQHLHGNTPELMQLGITVAQLVLAKNQRKRRRAAREKN